MSHKRRQHSLIDSDSDRTWSPSMARGTRKNVSYSRLAYLGKLPLEKEGGGVTPKICDIDWNNVPRMIDGSKQVFACTGSAGTILFCHAKDFDSDIEAGWIRRTLSDVPGRFCKWNPKQGYMLAIGCIRDTNQGEIYMVNCKKNYECMSVYKVRDGTGLLSLSWSYDGRYLLVTWHGKNIALLTRCFDQKTKSYKFSKTLIEVCNEPSDTVGSFHPSVLCFIIASDTIFMRFRHSEDQESKAIWLQTKSWRADGAVSSISFSPIGDRMACARLDSDVKVWYVKVDMQKVSLRVSLSSYTLGAKTMGAHCVTWSGSYLSVGNSQESICLFVGDKFLCDNGKSVNKTRLTDINQICWQQRLKHERLAASTGSDGFIQFWHLYEEDDVVEFHERVRDLTAEVMFYGSPPLPTNVVRGFREVYDEAQQAIKKSFDVVLAEDQRRAAQIDQIVLKARNALNKLYQGDTISKDEMVRLLESIVELGSKQVLKIETNPAINASRM